MRVTTIEKTNQTSRLLRIGAWQVDPMANRISKGNEVVRMEARTMRLLMYLAERAGEVVSIDELLSNVWAGVVVTQDSVYQGIANLRRHLTDDPKKPTYIATVPRLGYRMIASVDSWIDGPAIGTDAPADPMTTEPMLPFVDPSTANPRPRQIALILLGTIMAAMAAAYLVHNWLADRPRVTLSASIPQKAVAVLPFVDLTTQEMNEEYFADGLTEELIGDLGGMAELRVPAPTSSFFFKGKQMVVADIARQLGVTYVVDGSVRKSGNLYRVAIRLVRADDGYVIYTESYERSLGDLLSVQKNVAAAAATAIRKAIGGGQPAND